MGYQRQKACSVGRAMLHPQRQTPHTSIHTPKPDHNHLSLPYTPYLINLNTRTQTYTTLRHRRQPTDNHINSNTDFNTQIDIRTHTHTAIHTNSGGASYLPKAQPPLLRWAREELERQTHTHPPQETSTGTHSLTHVQTTYVPHYSKNTYAP